MRYTVYLSAEILVDAVRVVFVWVASTDEDYFLRSRTDHFVNSPDGYQAFRWVSLALDLFLPLLLTLLRLTQFEVMDVFSNKMDECCNRRQLRRGVITELGEARELEERRLHLVNIYQEDNRYKTRDSTQSGESILALTSRSSVKEQAIFLSINTLLTGLTYALSDLPNSNVLSYDRKENFLARP